MVFRATRVKVVLAVDSWLERIVSQFLFAFPGV